MCKLADYYNVSIDYLIGRETSYDIGYLDEIDRNILKISKQLNQNNKLQALAYISWLLTAQN